MKINLLVIGILAATGTQAEMFECQDGRYWSEKGKTVVEATISEDKKHGTIKVSGTTHQAQYKVDGFNRRWDFDLQPDDTYRYSFIIKPNGNAYYIDFVTSDTGKIAEASQYFICR